MGDYEPYSKYFTWTSKDDDEAEIWFGESERPKLLDQSKTPWEELYHEEDYQGIADQLRAEELGYPTI